MEPEEEVILVCMRESAAVIHAHESILKTCSQCGHNIWVSPASLIAAGRQVRLTCTKCVGDDICDDVIQTMTSAQLREISQAIGREVSQEEVDRIVGKLKREGLDLDVLNKS